MSQPKQYQDGESDPLQKPVGSIDDLVAFLDNAKRARGDFLVGVEHEKFGYILGEKKPLPFFGKPGIEAILLALVEEKCTLDGKRWQPILENGHVIALSNGAASVTLEPGGQIELSGAPLKTIHEVDRELNEYEAQIGAIARQMGVGFLTMGYQPFARREEIPWVPKQRYGIMRRYMPQVGGRGLDMMLRTCTVQANLDYESEADMAMSFKTALAISPFTTALFATSPFAEGKPSGLLSERTAVWQDTDPSRCGFVQIAFEDGFGYEKWVNFVLDVPMYFIRRDGQYVDLSGASFREFMREGLKGYTCTVRDFADHLTTTFTEVRIKPQIEMRSADCGPSSHLRALPAFWKGILYEPGARQKAWELMDGPNAEELHTLQLDMAKRGLKAQYRGQAVLPMLQRVLEICAQGLERLGCLDERGLDEQGYLKPLFDIVSRGETLADGMLRQFHGEWRGDVANMLEAKASQADVAESLRQSQ